MKFGFKTKLLNKVKKKCGIFERIITKLKV